MIKFRCPRCRTRMEAPDSLAGQEEACPECRWPVPVPVATHRQRLKGQAVGALRKFNSLPLTARLVVALIAAGVVIILAITALRHPPQRGQATIAAETDTNSAGAEAPLAPPTVQGWSKALEAKGWTFQKDNTVRGNAIMPDMRFVTYIKQVGDLKLSAQIMPSTKDGAIYAVSFGVRGPLESQTPAMKGFLACSAAAARLIPGAPEAIKQAVQNLQEHEKDWGLKRSEGKATAQQGWKVTCVEYLEGYKGSANVAKISLFFSLEDTFTKGGQPKSAKLLITDIGYKQVDSGFGYTTVAWKATVSNRGTQTLRCAVEAKFIDMERFELAKGAQYDVILPPGGSRVTGGTIMLKSAVYEKVVDLLVEVHGYPVAPR